MTDLIQNGKKVAVTRKFHQTVSSLKYFQHLGMQQTVAKHKAAARLCTAARPGQHLPTGSALWRKQQKFHVRSRALLNAKDTCRQNAGIVHYQAVSGTKQFFNIIKMAVRYLTGFSVQRHQPAVVTRFHRSLSDQFLRKIIKKFAALHESSDSFPFFLRNRRMVLS